MSKVVKIRRIETFSAAHRLHNDNLSAEENLRLFDKCNTLHGHNYKVEVEVKGEIDRTTGMVINISDLKKTMAEVLVQLDHQNLNEIDHFKRNNIPTTAENIVCFLFDQLSQKISELNLGLGVKLSSVVLHETEKNIVKYEE